MMNDRELSTYLGLGFSEFQQLQSRLDPATIEGYRLLDEVSPNLEQLPTRLNRPPEATEDSDAQLEALSVAAFGRLEASAQANEAFRRQRADGASRARQRRQRDPRDPLCRMPE